MKFLWLIQLEYATRLHHGATLRYLNYSRELIALGHQVYFAVQFQTGKTQESEEFFLQLEKDGTISGFFEVTCAYPAWRSRLARLSLFPAIANIWLRRIQTKTFNETLAKLLAFDIDAVIFSNRRLFFMARNLAKMAATVLDFGDCWTLYLLRRARFLVKKGEIGPYLNAIIGTVEAYVFERHYGRRSRTNIVVSSADRRAMDRITGKPEQNHVLLNGVSRPKHTAPTRKTVGRLIFSGNLNFPPNYEGALWFIDKVLPLVRASRPDVYLVLAGANPIRQLLDRMSDSVHVLGYVEDMSAEIAASSVYVAPMITGGGFKNKVVEALISGTYVVATSRAVEFLDPSVRQQLLIADSARGLADAVIRFVSNPDRFDQQLAALQSFITREFTWRKKTEELLSIVGNAKERMSIYGAHRASATVSNGSSSR